MTKRPLCVVLLLMIVVILCLYYGKEDDLPVYDGEERTLVCQLEELSGDEDSPSLLVRDVYDGQNKFCHKMKAYISGDGETLPELHIGNLLLLEASVYSFSKPGNAGQFNEFQYYQEQDISYKAYVKKVTVKSSQYNLIQDGMYRLRLHFLRLLRACCEEKDAGVVAAMLLGEKSGLPEETKKLYQENGIAHVLAISGLHISLIGAGIFFLLRRFVMPMQPAAVVTVILLLLYGILTGFSISAVRAILMMTCMLGARFVGRRYDLLSALSLSGILQLSIHPRELFQTGFLLSYGTVLGIAVFVRAFQRLSGKKAPLLQTILGSLGIQLVTLPILLCSYYEVSLYSVVANVLLVPCIGWILLLSAACIGFAGCQIILGRFCFGMVHYCLSFFEGLCRILNQLPWHNIVLGAPARWQIVIYYGCLAGWCFVPRRIDLYCEKHKKKHEKKAGKWLGENGQKIRQGIGIGLIVFALVVICLPVHRVSGVVITNLDVGQGDCTCIRTEQNTILIDGGSSDVSGVGKYRIVPYLKSQGISEISYLFLTHSDSDHTNGIEEILTDSDHMGLRIGKIVLPYIEKRDEGYEKLKGLCEQSGIPTVLMQKGDRIAMGELTFTCLHPYKTYDWQSENDYSLMLKVQYGSFSGLFMGDLEQTGEKELSGLSKVNYLKVGHHGSKGASGEEFLEQIRPTIAVLSAGKNNRYGHPSEETLARLAEVGAKTYCTIEGGAITVETDGETMQVREYK